MTVDALVEKILKDFNCAATLTIDETTQLLNEYRNLIKQQPVCLKIASGTMLVSGDIHGDFSIMKKIVSLFYQNKKIFHLIFIGDIVDRGSQSIACLNLLFALAIKQPKKIHFLRGNHEAISVNSRYGFIDEVRSYSGDKELYELFNKTFADLPLMLVHQKTKYFFVHGGIPISVLALEELEKLPKGDLLLENPLIMQLLWNDPKEDIERSSYSMRGMGIFTYGPELAKEFLKINGLKKIIRAHEAFSDGYKYFFNELLLSLFTSEEYYEYISAKIAFIDDLGTIKIFHPDKPEI